MRNFTVIAFTDANTHATSKAQRKGWKRRFRIEGSDPGTCLCYRCCVIVAVLSLLCYRCCVIVAVLSLLCYRCCALELGAKTRTQRGQAICTSVQPSSNKDCTSGNEAHTQNACASVPVCIVSYLYTVIVPCTVLYDVPINIAYKTLPKYFMQVLSFVPLVHITQTATRVGPNYTLHSQN